MPSRRAGSESATPSLPDRLGTLSCGQRAFEEVGGERDVMLWQTGEAQVFYEKLGARVVPTESIVDSSSSSGAEGGAPRAFWDLVAMIYPVRTWHLRFCTARSCRVVACGLRLAHPS